MTFPLTPASPFVDDVSTLDAATANAWRTYISRALDGANGGSYTLGANIVLTGNGFVIDYLRMSGTNKVLVTSRSITRIISYPPTSRYTGGAFDWTSEQYGKFTAAALAGSLEIPLYAPHNSTVTTIAVHIDPAGAHVGLPANMPSIDIVSVDGLGNVTSLATATDTSVNVAAYEVAHTITATGLSIVMNRNTNRYAIRLVGESGANALVGTSYIYTAVTYTITEMDED